MYIYKGIVIVQGRIQDLKLGVAQMDWKIWKPGVGVGVGGVCGCVCVCVWGGGNLFIYFRKGKPFSYTVLPCCPVTK